MTATDTTQRLALPDWQARAETHRARAKSHTVPARNRSDRGEPHPIADFLFEYYPFSFGFLEKWHPGIGVILESPITPPPHLSSHWYRHDPYELQLDRWQLTEKKRLRFQHIIHLLESTRDRTPNFACHGLHEWAMVYQGHEIRHEKTLTLRLPQKDIDAVVEARPICCSHFDAFRFFARTAQPFNLLQPTLESRPSHDQPACLHANMDLYKWAAKAMPWVGSELLLDCFELAVDLRDLDMRASPYDLTKWDRPPVRIETPEGRQQYEHEQRALAMRAKPLRESLIVALKATMKRLEIED